MIARKSEIITAGVLTHDYYERHATEYFNKTVSADLSHLYKRFLPQVKPNGRVLDAGCGSGRDLKKFRELGFDAQGLDASAALVDMAKAYAGVPCVIGRFEDIEHNQVFDGVWSCASLVHLPRKSLLPVLRRLRRALVPGGVLFVSVLCGSGEGIGPDGRYYYYYQRDEFSNLVREAGFKDLKIWVDQDSLLRGPSVSWITILGTS